MKTTPKRLWWAAIPIAILVVVAFGPVGENGFVDIDDKEGLVQNPHLQSFSGENIKWALTSTDVDAYQPLARLVQMAEYAAWGIDSRGYHVASLVLHIAVSIALFLLTAAIIRLARPDWEAQFPARVDIASAIATTLFSVHPLRTEVVAWAICQAYLPCAIFTILSVLAYLRSNESGRSNPRWLAISIMLFAVAMGFYQVPVALPLVLLVLDVFPLRRRDGWCRILIEKLPYFGVSLVFGFAALMARRPDDGVIALVETGIGARAVQAAYASCFYLVKSAVPWGLCHVYPLRDAAELGEPRFALSVLAVLAISIGAVVLRRRYPVLPCAWLTYLLVLAPNSGLVRNIGVVAADRYSYFATATLVPSLAAGLFFILGAKRHRRALCLAAVLPALLLVPISRVQCSYWSDAVALWSRAVVVQDRPEWFLSLNLGVAHSDAGQTAEARHAFAAAAKLNPHSPLVHDKLGLALLASGDSKAAEAEFKEASRLDPNDFESHMNLGFLDTQANRIASAQAHLTRAVKIRPTQVEARLNLGALLAQQGRSDLAENEFAEAARLVPSRAECFMNLGFSLLQQDKFAKAESAYAEAVKLRPDDPDARSNLGYTLGRLGKFPESIASYERALALKPDHEAARRGLVEVRWLERGRTAIRAN